MIKQRLANTDLELDTFVGQITARAPRNAVFKLVESLTSPTTGYQPWKHQSHFNFNISNELSIWCIKVMWALYGHSSFNWPPIFEWYVVRVAVKNGHQKDMCNDDLKLCGQNLNTILGSIGNTNWEVLWDRSTRKRVFTMGPLITFASPLPFWNLKWQSTWFTITSWLRQFSSWSNCQNYLWIRKCPQ